VLVLYPTLCDLAAQLIIIELIKLNCTDKEMSCFFSCSYIVFLRIHWPSISTVLSDSITFETYGKSAP